MKILLLALIGFMTLSSVFAWDPGPLPGVKIKNAILYLLMVGLMFRFAVDRNLKLELPGLHLTFLAVLAYAILSYLAVVLVIHYPRYNVLNNGLNLKGFIDQFLFFLVFFYGIRSEKNGIFLLKCLLATWALSHVTALLDAMDIMHFGDMELRSDGRVQGLVGESNQYGAFVALSLPPLIAIAMTTRGFQRTLWMGAVLLTAITLIMTVSRGAFVAAAVAGVWALFVFRRYASFGRLALLTGLTVLAVILTVTVAISLGFGQLLYERLVSDTLGTDLGTTSSGRSQIWTEVLAAMFREPITVLSGFGWRAYWTMPFRFSPHNYYLNQWFNLGLIGLVSSVLLFVLPIATVRKAVAGAPPHLRAIFIGFAVAAVAFAVATFFVDLYVPWLYFWAFAGIVLRLAVNPLYAVSDKSDSSETTPAPYYPTGWRLNYCAFPETIPASIALQARPETRGAAGREGFRM